MIVLRRAIGFLLILAAVSGLAISLLGIISLWRLYPRVSASLETGVSLIGETLETTADGLSITQEALESSLETIVALHALTQSSAQTIAASQPLLDEIAQMMETTLPNTLEATQQSLRTAQSSARVVDGLLGALSIIPFVGSSLGYNPEVPLATALGEVADSLDGLPASLEATAGSLKEAKDSFQTFEADLSEVSLSIAQIQTHVAEYERVIQNYQASLERVERRLAALQASIPNAVRTVSWALTAFLIWLAVAQIGLFTQGWELLTEAAALQRSEPPSEGAPSEQEEPAA